MSFLIFFPLYGKCFCSLRYIGIQSVGGTSLANVFLTEAQAKQKALHTIRELAKYYNVVIWSDDESESDATEVMVQELTVDDYMEALLDEWGMDWQKVLKLGMQHMQAQPQQQAGVKRAGDANSRGEKKKTRARGEESD